MPTIFDPTTTNTVKSEFALLFLPKLFFKQYISKTKKRADFKNYFRCFRNLLIKREKKIPWK